MVLGSIGVISCDEREAQGKQLQQQDKQIQDTALSIFDEAMRFNQELSLNRIMNDAHIAHDQGMYVRFLTSLMTTSQVALNFYEFLVSKGPIPWFAVDRNDKIPCDYVPKRALVSNGPIVKDSFHLDQLLNKVSNKAKTQFNPTDSDFWRQIDLLHNKHMCGFDVQNGKIIVYASSDNSSLESETALQGLFKVSYSIQSKECSITLIIPVKERQRLLNVFIWLLHARIVHGIKSSPKIMQYSSGRNSIRFDDIHLDYSSQLGWFLRALKDAYKLKDIAKKYEKEPKVNVHIKALKTIDRILGEKSYPHLCNYVETLKSGTSP